VILLINYLNGDCRVYKHKSGASVVHIKNDDPISTFALSFRTPSEDASGTAHIVEHCLLCGSKKYPFDDPSAELSKSSLYTYLNAMTYDDMTIYLGGSFVEKSLYHMMDVYFDGVFNPFPTRETFNREKIVVCNEMTPSSYDTEENSTRSALNMLFPDEVLRFSGAGVPEQINHLTYEKFLEYYYKYYTPSNCLAFFYGNANPNEFFNKIDFYLNNTPNTNNRSSIVSHNFNDIELSYFCKYIKTGRLIDICELPLALVLPNETLETFEPDKINDFFDLQEILLREKDFGYRTTGIVASIDCAHDFIRGFDFVSRLEKLEILSETRRKAVNNGLFEKILMECLTNGLQINENTVAASF